MEWSIEGDSEERQRSAAHLQLLFLLVITITIGIYYGNGMSSPTQEHVLIYESFMLVICYVVFAED
jgi:hypothetical protein